jgi:putative endonuclease
MAATRRSSTRERGRYGEALAEEYLRRVGFRILARNLHLRHSELDILAMERGTLCFVEVRLRSGGGFGSAAESVDARKQRRLIRAAREVLARGGLPRFSALRFDVVAIDAGRRPPEIRLIREAFYAETR